MTFFSPERKTLSLSNPFEQSIVLLLASWISNTQNFRFCWQSSYILRRPQNFAKSPPIIWLAEHRTNNWWRFCKILWPSQNTWTAFFYFQMFQVVFVQNVSTAQLRLTKFPTSDRVSLWREPWKKPKQDILNCSPIQKFWTRILSLKIFWILSWTYHLRFEIMEFHIIHLVKVSGAVIYF